MNKPIPSKFSISEMLSQIRTVIFWPVRRTDIYISADRFTQRKTIRCRNWANQSRFKAETKTLLEAWATLDEIGESITPHRFAGSATCGNRGEKGMPLETCTNSLKFISGRAENTEGRGGGGLPRKAIK
ncbi:MAG: hypothetical protein PVG85_04240 [Deltaproteobacteria bacterium]